MEQWSFLGLLKTDNEAVNQERIQMYRDYWNSLLKTLTAMGLRFQLAFNTVVTKMTIFVDMPDGKQKRIQFRSLSEEPPLRPVIEFDGTHHWTDDSVACAMGALT